MIHRPSRGDQTRQTRLFADRAFQGIASLLLFVLGALFFSPSVVFAENASSSEYLSPAAVEQKTEEVFADTPVLINIAHCESGFRQYTTDGQPFHGGAGGQMIGVMQLYGSIHEKAAQALGFDINTLEGNLGYAKHLYEQQGTQPWTSSESCWGGMTVPEVKASEQTASPITEASYNAKATPVLQLASTGSGSPASSQDQRAQLEAQILQLQKMVQALLKELQQLQTSRTV
ncbi:MAG TPA: hypothetical protein VFM02_00090 [Candidatus Paceibacterota bacterium]|nr:hypothetical protein [Candidatus Paceibacterota bacterium]